MRRVAVILVVAIVSCSSLLCSQTKIGIFDDHADVGTVLHAGSVDYDPAQKTYTIAGSGENMWLS